jgi:hypothetical protein
MAGEFEQLLPFSWRGLHLPVLSISLSLAHDIVEHKYWGVDGGRIESTGVAPVRISAVIPVSNSIVPGKNEKWQAGVLYPEALRKFIIEFAKKQTGYVQHPELGEIACKPEQMSFDLAGDKQDSTEIKASWVETLDEALISKIVNSPVTDIEIAASDLNASLTDLKSLLPEVTPELDDLESLGRKLVSVIDRFSALSYRVVGIANRILYQAHRLEVAIDRVSSGQMTQLSPLRPIVREKSRALAWPVMQALQRIQEGAYSVRRSALSDRGVGLYYVPEQTTVANLPRQIFAVTVAELLKLNPNLAAGPIVPKGTVVRFPLPK